MPFKCGKIKSFFFRFEVEKTALNFFYQLINVLLKEFEIDLSTMSPSKMIFMRIFHVYTGGHFVVVVLVKQQKIHF